MNEKNGEEMEMIFTIEMICSDRTKKNRIEQTTRHGAALHQRLCTIRPKSLLHSVILTRVLCTIKEEFLIDDTMKNVSK